MFGSSPDDGLPEHGGGEKGVVRSAASLAGFVGLARTPTVIGAFKR
jgi:hypothetical protein